MSKKYYSDLHCHPTMLPMMLSKETLWDTYFTGKKFRRIIKFQKKGKRGGLYDQSGYPKLLNARVKLVYVALYPLEQGFMVNTGWFWGLLDFVAKGGPFGKFVLNPMGKNGHLRDLGLSIFTKFRKRKIRELKGQEYWDGFMNELDYYHRDNRKSKKISKKSKDEMEALKSLVNIAAIKEKGKFVVADKEYVKPTLSDLKEEDDDKIITVFTMEGIGTISQTKRGAKQSKHGTRLIGEGIIRDRIDFLKRKTPMFFITFSHHFSSELCGHARSFPQFARDLGFLNQDYFIDENFSRFGYEILLKLLSVRFNNGDWENVESPTNRRILIDVKHMSLRGRLSLYQVVKGYNKVHDKKIPLIASHVGFSNRTIGEMLYTIKNGGDKSKNQADTEIVEDRKHLFNTWSINLGVEEIAIIVESGGLIGISLEQNILGVPFMKKIKNVSNSFFPRLIMNQILAMAKASKTHDFWNCVTMGSDYDGLIDPVDEYSSVLFYPNLRENLKKEFSGISEDEKDEAFMFKPDNHGKLVRLALDELLDKLFFDNAYTFFYKHFDTDKMPVFKQENVL